MPFRHSLLTGRQQRVPDFDTNDVMMIKISAEVSLRDNGLASPEIKMILGRSASKPTALDREQGLATGLPNLRLGYGRHRPVNDKPCGCPLQFCSAQVRRASLLCTLSHRHSDCPHRAQIKTESAIIDRAPATLM